MKNPITVLTIRLPEHESQILKEHCGKTGRSQSDVVREFIRGLNRNVKARRLDDGMGELDID